MDYAGFWVRVGAYLIDFIALIVLQVPFAFIFGETFFASSTGEVGYTLGNGISLLVSLAYFIGFEASAKQATPGKMALGLVVTDLRGGRISYARATGRYFAKILSGLFLLIGYIMVAFTAHKQGLHDLLAQTLVVRGTPGTVGVDPDVFA